MATAAALALAAVAGVWLDRRSQEAEAAPIRSIAVLPLDDLANDQDTYFADGMTDALIAELGKLTSLG